MFIYLHGFASSGKSNKSQALIDAFGASNVWAPDLPMNPREVVALVDDFIKNNPQDKIVFVGTSLGGFYARYFSSTWDAPCVLVNPSTRPSVTMKEKLGTNKNYSTGKEFQVTDDDLRDFSQMEETLKLNRPSGALIDLFLAEDDSVLEYKTALTDIPFTNSTTITKDGGHRFDTNFDQVIKVLKKFE